jgi:hypothetical protein
MNEYQIEFSIKFDGVPAGGEEYTEYSFSHVINVEANSFAEAEEEVYSQYENDMDDIMSDECSEAYYSSDETGDDAVHIETINIDEPDSEENGLMHIRYPDDSEDYPSTVNDKWVKHYAIIWDQDKADSDDDYEPDEFPVFR